MMVRARKQSRRGAVAVMVIIVLLLTGLFIIGIVSGSARDLDTSARRLETIQAFYAAEAGMNMAIREMMNNADEDGDGTIGTISDDATPGNDPTLGSAQFFVTATTAGAQTTLISQGRSGEARREAEGLVVTQSGFTWFTNAYDVSLGTTGSWQDIDLSPYLPTGTTGAIVELVNTSIKDKRGVVRGKEDTRDYMSDPNSNMIKGDTHRYQIVKVDANRLIQGYITSNKVDFKLHGYTTGTDPSYFNTPPDITPATAGAWTIVDLGPTGLSLVDAETDGVILLISSSGSGSGEVDYGIREVGSTDQPPPSFDGWRLTVSTNTMYLVGLDAAKRLEAYRGVASVNIYLVGQTKGSVVYYTNDLAVADVGNGWTALDADSYSVPEEANGLVFFTSHPSAPADKSAGFRHGDSTDAWDDQLSAHTSFQAATGISDANLWQQRQGTNNTDVFIAAYTKAATASAPRLVRWQEVEPQ